MQRLWIEGRVDKVQLALCGEQFNGKRQRRTVDKERPPRGLTFRAEKPMYLKSMLLADFVYQALQKARSGEFFSKIDQK
ncbi:hypothetical protein RB623_00290 [Mesorhizobium sp. LHD-90]|uniref:hypothetical protein n=1 Tax=Mesorhizobium sp. LHD-90 TaxID=3071414 RepID=UPI0027E1D783|nr:hypothetical protein [Mesorhizobium sp. LHD-90]MDQ6432487.1 hypothetical protein [Mesorhizobium sp. LHD-90]